VKPYYEHAGITIYHGDCREILPQLPKGWCSTCGCSLADEQIVAIHLATKHDVGPLVDLCITDPPYPGLKGGTRIDFDSGVAGRAESVTVGTPWGEDITPLADAYRACRFGMFVFCSYHFAASVPGILGAQPISLITWYKRNSMPSANNVPQYETEFIWAFKKCPGLEWRKLRGFYDIPALQAGCMAQERFVDNGRATHPAQKPKELIACLLKIGGESVLDPYMGTGTTLTAAKEIGISAIGIEIEEKYCEISAKRLSQEVFQFETAEAK